MYISVFSVSRVVNYVGPQNLQGGGDIQPSKGEEGGEGRTRDVRRHRGEDTQHRGSPQITR